MGFDPGSVTLSPTKQCGKLSIPWTKKN